MKNAQSGQFVTSSQAAKALNVSLRTVQLWVESGILRAWKTAGGHRRIARDSVDKLLREQSAVSEPVMESSHKRPDLPNILVVEDQRPLLKLYELYFKEWNLPAVLHTASNGFDGLIKVGQFRPCFIICDLLMPSMNGFEMIAALNDNPEQDATIIVVTGLSEMEIEERGRLPSGVQVFCKPPPFDRIRMLVQERLDSLRNVAVG